MSPVAIRKAPPLPPLQLPPRRSARGYWLIALAAVPLAVFLVVGEYRWFRDRQAVRDAAWAAQEEAARKEAQRAEAEELRKAVDTALAQQQPSKALQLLHAYLDHPQAERAGEARQLCDELERALSDREAARLLARLSDEALTVFSQTGRLTESDGLHNPAAQAIFRQTLRRNVSQELQKRAAQRENTRLAEAQSAVELLQQVARLRQTPTYQALADSLAGILEQSREQQQGTQARTEEMDQLFQQLGVTDAAEQAEYRARLSEGEKAGDFRHLFEEQRIASKRAYRRAPEFQAADQPLFNQLVDAEVDRYLKMLPSS